MEARHPCWESGIGDGVEDIRPMDVSCRASEDLVLDYSSGGVVGRVLVVIDGGGKLGEDGGGAGGGGSELGFCPGPDGEGVWYVCFVFELLKVR